MFVSITCLSFLSVMINFCKNTLQTLLGTSSKKSETRNGGDRTVPVCTGGLCLLAAGECLKSANVVDSASVKTCTNSGPERNDVSGGGCLGFLDEIGGGADGLSSCTESLGFESSDQVENMSSSVVDDEEKKVMIRSTVGLSWRKESREKSRWRERVKNLPPPLSSLNSNGQSNFFLKSVRENGRLVLTSVERPEVFLAERKDGRLRLHLIQSDDDDDVSDSDLEEDVEVEVAPIVDEVVEEVEEEEEEEDVDVEEEEEEVHVEWMMSMRSGGGGGGEGFRRCHELSSHHHRNHYNHHHHHHHNHHHLQCVTTR